MAERQGVRAEQEHRPDDLARERLADAHRVAHQQVLLQLRRAGRFDERRGQVAEAGGDAVHDRTLGDERLDDRTGFVHARAGMDVEGSRCAMAGHGLDIADGQVGSGEDDRSRGAVAARRARIEMRPARRVVAGRRIRSGHPPRIVGYAAARVRLPERARP